MSSETHCKQLNMSNMNVVPCRSKITARLKAGNWQTDRQTNGQRQKYGQTKNSMPTRILSGDLNNLFNRYRMEGI